MEVIHLEDRAHVVRLLEKAIREKADFAAGCRIVRPDGTIRFIRSVAQPVFNEAGEVVEYVGTVIDRTEQLCAQEELQKTQTRLAKVAHIRTMGEMAAAIAHEINQPLGAIVNNSSYCLKLVGEGSADGKKRAALEDIVNDANRASAIIARIRGLTNGSASETTELKIADLIAEIVTLAQHALTEHGIEVKTQVARNLPHLDGDRVQLQQVLLNLVMNAIEAMIQMEKKGRILTIRARRHEMHGDAAVMIEVSDTGAGFKPEVADRMFEAFYTTRVGGLGMGLRISRSIVEACGGQLLARRNRGKGATFSCVLPLKMRIM